MSFLVDTSTEDLRIGESYRAYVAYLASIKDRLPQAAYEFAVADWHYDFTKPNCPHDAWVQEIKIKEIAEGERHEIRTTQIEILLLGAYHDRLLRVTYPGVTSHFISSGQSQCRYGDWLIDEIGLSDAGQVVHEVKFANMARLRIESADIIFQEQLTTTPYTAEWK